MAEEAWIHGGNGSQTGRPSVRGGHSTGSDSPAGREYKMAPPTGEDPGLSVSP